MTEFVDRRALETIELELLAIHHDVRMHASSMAKANAATNTNESIANRPRSKVDFDSLRRTSEATGLGELFSPRIDELELDLALIGSKRSARARLLRARWGDASALVACGVATLPLAEVARRLIHEPTFDLGPARSPRARSPAIASVRPAARDAVDADPLARLGRFAMTSGLRIDVRYEPGLVADAASGEYALYLRPKAYRTRDLMRLAAHEIHGHLVAAANAREQPLALLRIGCASSWQDQEGVALVLEERAGTLDRERLGTLAARILAVAAWFDGASEPDTVLMLVRDHGVLEEKATTAARRAFRGGGTARDLSYLVGYSRVRAALDDGVTTLDELRMGRVSTSALPTLRRLLPMGLVAPPRHRPSLAMSLRDTFSGTSLATSPPRRAASLTRLEET